MIYWAITRVMGAMLGFAILHALDEGLLDEALLSGAMIPPPTPEARFKFLVLCTLVPEIPVAGMLASWVAKRRQ